MVLPTIPPTRKLWQANVPEVTSPCLHSQPAKNCNGRSANAASYGVWRKATSPNRNFFWPKPSGIRPVSYTHLTLPTNRVSLLASHGIYGQTFQDRFAFQAVELGLEPVDVAGYRPEELPDKFRFVAKEGGRLSDMRSLNRKRGLQDG